MIVYFANRKLDILGLASTHLKNGFCIIDDNRTEDVKSGSSTFEFVVVFTNDRARRELESMCEAGNYILCEDDGQNFYTIIDEEIDVTKREFKLYCEDAGLDLINTVVEPFTANEPQNIEYYIDAFVSDDGFEIGSNELDSDYTLLLEWTNDQTAKERILDVCNQFNEAEIAFSFVIDGLTVTHKYVNIYKKRGQNNEETLRLGKEIDNITVKKSVSNLATALYVTGGQDDNGNPVTLYGLTYDDGDFFVDGLYLRSRNAVAAWNRYTNGNTINTYDRHIIRSFSYQTTVKQELLQKAIDELKKVCVPEVNYSANVISLPESVRVGDRVNIVDEKGELYLSTRILNLQKSVTARRYSVTLGEYELRTSGISDTVRQLAEDFKNYTEKNPVYIWIVYADDDSGTNITLDSTGKEYIGIYHTREGADPDLTRPELYSWSKIQGEDGTAGADGYSPTVAIDTSTPGQSTITITDKTGSHSAVVSDGEDGKTYYGTVSTSASSADKTVSLIDTSFELYSGVAIVVKFISGNTSPTMTLNVNNTGVKNVVVNNSTNVSGKLDIPANTTVSFTYDGTNFSYTSSDNLLNDIRWTEDDGLSIHATPESNSRVNITTDSVDIYNSDGDLGSSTDATGLTIYNNNDPAAKFSSVSTIGKEGQNRTIFGSDSFVMIDQYNKKLLQIKSVQYEQSHSEKITETTDRLPFVSHDEFEYTLKNLPDSNTEISAEWWCFDKSNSLVWQERGIVYAGTEMGLEFSDVDQYGHEFQTGTLSYNGNKTFTIEIEYSEYIDNVDTYEIRFTYNTSDSGYAPEITVFLRSVDELYQRINALGWTNEVIE